MKTLKVNMIAEQHCLSFSVSEELLLAGLKLSYVTPKKLEREIFNALKSDDKYISSIQNDCLEEGLMNSYQDSYEITNNNIQVNTKWHDD